MMKMISALDSSSDGNYYYHSDGDGSDDVDVIDNAHLLAYKHYKRTPATAMIEPTLPSSRVKKHLIEAHQHQSK